MSKRRSLRKRNLRRKTCWYCGDDHDLRMYQNRVTCFTCYMMACTPDYPNGSAGREFHVATSRAELFAGPLHPGRSAG